MRDWRIVGPIRWWQWLTGTAWANPKARLFVKCFFLSSKGAATQELLEVIDGVWRGQKGALIDVMHIQEGRVVRRRKCEAYLVEGAPPFYYVEGEPLLIASRLVQGAKRD